MKHLKRIFESTEEETMIEDLNDIILDIKDLGFFVGVTSSDFIITVTISKLVGGVIISKGPLIKNERELNELIEVISRIRDYARLNGYLIDTTWLARLKNMNEKELNRAIHDNSYIIWVTMYPKSR